MNGFMKKTVADLLGPQSYSGPFVGSPMEVRDLKEMLRPNQERVFTVSIVLDPNEVEVLDNKAVIEKRVIAHNRQEALDKCGFTVKE